MAAPMFTSRTKSQQKFVKKLPGDKMSLVCEALGSPRPSTHWIHDGRSLPSRPNLLIHTLTEDDSGVYTCVASNLAGSAQLEFSVTVESPRVELPSISKVGNVRQLECKWGTIWGFKTKTKTKQGQIKRWMQRTLKTKIA